MNQNYELRLHIATPTGVGFNDLVTHVQVKVHDGYMGVNKNQLPNVRIVQLGVITIKMLDGSSQSYLIGPGAMLIDKFFCQIYAEFFIDVAHIDNDEFWINHKKIEQLIFDQKLEGIFDAKTELSLRNEILKLQNEITK